MARDVYDSTVANPGRWTLNRIADARAAESRAAETAAPPPTPVMPSARPATPSARPAAGRLGDSVRSAVDTPDMRRQLNNAGRAVNEAWQSSPIVSAARAIGGWADDYNRNAFGPAAPAPDLGNRELRGRGLAVSSAPPASAPSAPPAAKPSPEFAAAAEPAQATIAAVQAMHARPESPGGGSKFAPIGPSAAGMAVGASPYQDQASRDQAILNRVGAINAMRQAIATPHTPRGPAVGAENSHADQWNAQVSQQNMFDDARYQAQRIAQRYPAAQRAAVFESAYKGAMEPVVAAMRTAPEMARLGLEGQRNANQAAYQQGELASRAENTAVMRDYYGQQGAIGQERNALDARRNEIADAHNQRQADIQEQTAQNTAAYQDVMGRASTTQAGAAQTQAASQEAQRRQQVKEKADAERFYPAPELPKGAESDSASLAAYLGSKHDWEFGKQMYDALLTAPHNAGKSRDEILNGLDPQQRFAMRAFLRGDRGPGYAEGGMIQAPQYGAPPSAEMASPIVDAYRRYVVDAQAAGVPTVPFEQFAQIKASAHQAVVAAQPAPGAVQMAAGGPVPGGRMVFDARPNAPTDSIPAVIDGQHPAKLDSGEFIIPKEAAKYYGTKFLNALIEKAKAASEGGAKPAAAPAPEQEDGEMEVEFSAGGSVEDWNNSVGTGVGSAGTNNRWHQPGSGIGELNTPAPAQPAPAAPSAAPAADANTPSRTSHGAVMSTYQQAYPGAPSANTGVGGFGAVDPTSLSTGFGGDPLAAGLSKGYAGGGLVQTYRGK